MSFQTLQELTVQASVARVNLLPDGLDDARNFRKLQLGLGAVLVGVVGVVGAAYVVGTGHVTSAEDALAAEQVRTTQLQSEQRRYADVPKVEAQVTAAEQAQVAVNAYNVNWYSMLDAVAANSPETSSMESLSLALDATAIAPGGAGTVEPSDPLGVAGVGTVTLTGSTISQDKVAAVLEGLARVPGLAHPLLSNSTYAADTGVVDYSTTATITHDALLNKQ